MAKKLIIAADAEKHIDKEVIYRGAHFTLVEVHDRNKPAEGEEEDPDRAPVRDTAMIQNDTRNIAVYVDQLALPEKKKAKK